MRTIAVGLLAALPLAGVFLLYLLVRGDAFVAMLGADSGEMAAVSNTTLKLMVGTGFVMASLLFGVMASVMYRWLGSPLPFAALALGAAVALSLLAVISKTPMPADKVAMNLAVALVLGALVPMLSRVLVG